MQRKARPLPPWNKLNNLFTYDPDTGVVIRNMETGGQVKGAIVSSRNSQGYIRVQIDEVEYKLHRVIWKLYYKEEPADDQVIDHINRVRDDNRIGNLRLCSQRDNGNNRTPNKPRQKPNRIREGGVY
jgi:hypothetical protein